mmetsp:Transcript_6362/g.10045  ORF Transcript_6362/g.10045 Transcript_6362/m.10045 type:complete len:93 (-) Transcript_6362:1298-1576(-)
MLQTTFQEDANHLLDLPIRYTLNPACSISITSHKPLLSNKYAGLHIVEQACRPEVNNFIRRQATVRELAQPCSCRDSGILARQSPTLQHANL